MINRQRLRLRGVVKPTAILASVLIGLLVSADPAHAKCISMLVRVQGNVVGQIQEGDELLLRFIYSPKRVETSAPEPMKGQTFTLVGAYSTYKRTDLFRGDVCGATPRRIQLVMRSKDGTVLDTVDLMTADAPGETAELSYGKKQLVVIHRASAPRS